MKLPSGLFAIITVSEGKEADVNLATDPGEAHEHAKGVVMEFLRECGEALQARLAALQLWFASGRWQRLPFEYAPGHLLWIKPMVPTPADPYVVGATLC